MAPEPVLAARSWARDAVIYQIYVRSFADSNGDGVGDLRGVASRLDHLVWLGVDALWLTPFYPSPMADGGYDVADYRDVDPIFGTLADFDALLAQVHERGLRLVIDLVPNHCSSAHEWFRAAVAAGPGSPPRRLFHFRGGEHPPNGWQSVFGGPAWTRLADGEWYLHLFAPEQPDLNWDHPQVRAEFADILRFWLERGVDGVRIDVAHGLVKPPDLSDPTAPFDAAAPFDAGAPFDQDGVHDIYRRWRAVLDAYQPERIAVAEAWLPSLERIARYVRPDELHQAFNFELLQAPWSGPAYRRVIEETLAAMDAVGAGATWVMSNHDVVRHVSRLARGVGGQPGGADSADGAAADSVGGAAADTSAADPVGVQRARAVIVLMLALPGCVYLYQGEELGLPEVFDLPAQVRQDPIFARTGGAQLGRDGCRVPLPWSGDRPPFGFGPAGSTPWLPQPARWASLSVQAQAGDAASMLAHYRRAIELRRRLTRAGVLSGGVRWLSRPGDDTLVFERGPASRSLICAVNHGPTPCPLSTLPPVCHGEPILTSQPLTRDAVAPDGAAWWASSD